MLRRCVDDIVRTVKSEPTWFLDVANSLHPNLQFTLEETNSKGNLTFFDLIVILSKDTGVTCSWYQKPTDTVATLNSRSVFDNQTTITVC